MIITQTVDSADPILGFFHGWIVKLATHYEQITVICLRKGKFSLPPNVEVFSLGKEDCKGRFYYIFNFYKYIIKMRKNYESVLVHMNQEYILLGGLFWMSLNKKIYMWRNHYAGNFLTDIAAGFCAKVFCTSRFSYTAKYQKTILMPVGIDRSKFNVDYSVERIPNSILSLGRISPSKNIHILIDALIRLHTKNIFFTASIYGNYLPKDRLYFNNLKQKIIDAGLNDRVLFYEGVPNDVTPAIYSSHTFFINLSKSGMLDKTILEAMCCGCTVLATSLDLDSILTDNYIVRNVNIETVSESMAFAMNTPSLYNQSIPNFLNYNSLDNLCKMFVEHIK
jgi:glycosyltransferase involved in cell wall biosynthesis